MATSIPRLRRHSIRLYAVWPGDDHVKVEYGGLPIIVPPVTVVAETGGASPYRCPSPVDGVGRKIPGAVVLESVVSLDPATQGIRTEFDALEWAEGLESVNRAVFARGFKIVDSVEEIAKAQTEGRPLWEEKMLDHWRNVLAQERRRRIQDEKDGKPFTNGSNAAAVREAVEGINRISAKQRERAIPDAEIDRLLGVNKAGPVGIVPTPAPVADVDVPKADRTNDVIAEKLLSICHAKNVRLTNAEVMGLVKRDEAAMEAVEKKLEAAGVDLAAEMTGGA